MTTPQIISELKKAGSDSIKKILFKHGAKEPIYGVKIEELKKIHKKIKADQQKIALELFDSGISDAQYLAGLMADGRKMNRKQLNGWANKAGWSMISEYSVAWVACENEDAFSIALAWIDSRRPNVTSSGWCTLSSLVATQPDEKLDIPALRKLLKRIEKEIEGAPNRVRYCMNGFVIAAGSFVKDLTKDALDTGKKIGSVEVDVGETTCKVSFAPDYINKVIQKGNLGKKKKTAKC
jgi:3-methyladenine DNA glycosylase AlkD